MSNFQRELFRLPRAKTEPISRHQVTLLTWLTYGDGQLPAKFQRSVLRTLLRKKWVERIGSAPAVYRVTPYGQAARTRGGSKAIVSRETLAQCSVGSEDESAADAAV